MALLLDRGEYVRDPSLVQIFYSALSLGPPLFTFISLPSESSLPRRGVFRHLFVAFELLTRLTQPCLVIDRNSGSQGPRPAVTKYKQLNAPPVVPDGFTEWNEVMDRWGSKVSAISLPREDILA